MAEIRYKRERNPDHPLADKEGRAYVHRRVLFDSIGAGQHPCHWCAWQVTWVTPEDRQNGPVDQWTELTAEHVDGDIHHNTIDNLVPACRWCQRNRQELWKDGARTPAEFTGVAPWTRPWLAPGVRPPAPDRVDDAPHPAAAPAVEIVAIDGDHVTIRPVCWDDLIDVAAWRRGEVVVRGDR